MFSYTPRYLPDRADGHRIFRKMHLLNRYVFLIRQPSNYNRDIKPIIVGMVRIPIVIARIISDYSTELVDWISEHSLFAMPWTISDSVFKIYKSDKHQKITFHAPDITWFCNIPIYWSDKSKNNSWSEYNDRDMWEAALEYIYKGQKIDPVHIGRFPWHIAMFMRTCQLHF